MAAIEKDRWEASGVGEAQGSGAAAGSSAVSEEVTYLARAAECRYVQYCTFVVEVSAPCRRRYGSWRGAIDCYMDELHAVVTRCVAS